MKRIKLTKGHFAIVDDDVYDLMNQYSWYYSSGYAIRDIYNKGATKKILMHREIYKIKCGDISDNIDIDHKDRNRLNNCVNNLRIATKQQNSFNRGVQSNNASSRYKGVKLNKKNGNWIARITIDGKEIRIGTFTSEIACANAYNHRAKELFGEFAYINEVEHMSKEEIKKYQCRSYKKAKNKYKGISFKKNRNKWMIQLYGLNSELIYLGYYDTENDALAIRNKYITEHTELLKKYPLDK